MRFSIVTPSFNAARWIRGCVRSVADQSVPHQHIIQDAGSTDGSRAWLAAQPGIELHVESDTGMYDAINRGLRRATGDLLGYLNTDEQYLPETLATVRAFFAHHPSVDVLVGDAILLDAGGRPISYRRIVTPQRLHTRLLHLGSLSCATFFRRRVIDEGVYFDPAWKAIGDAEWIYRVIENGFRIHALSQPFAAFTMTGGNLGASDAAREEMDRWAAGLPQWQLVLRPAVALHHRLRKSLAGAYRARTIDAQLYPYDEDEDSRRSCRANIGFRWSSG